MTNIVSEPDNRLLLDQIMQMMSQIRNDGHIAINDLGGEFTDLGNARRFVALFGNEIRYNHETNTWYCWNGSHWKADTSGEIVSKAKQMVDGLTARAKSTMDREFQRHAHNSGNAARISRFIELARTEPGVPVEINELDTYPMLLNCLNGTLDLSTGELLPHNQAHLITKCLPINFDPNAVCPQWEQFVNRIFGGQSDVIAYIQRVVGYILTGETKEQCVFILVGDGQNGKSTFLQTIRRMLADYAMDTPIHTFSATKRNSSASNDLARLKGARYVTCVEGDANDRWSESLIKKVSGQDQITSRMLYSEYRPYEPTFKAVFASNSFPVISGTDDGIWRRLHMVRMPVRISDNERDNDLDQKLKAELPGILAWSVRGCLVWHRTRLDVPDSVSETVRECRRAVDVVGTFLSDCCDIGTDYECNAGDLVHQYARFCGAECNPKLMTRFGTELSLRGFGSRKSNSIVWRLGLRIKNA